MMRATTKTILVLLTMFGLVVRAYANGPEWIAFDRDFPQHYIDQNSIVHMEKTIVRFWERGGERIVQKADGPHYAQYTLTEIDCARRLSRTISWDMALEDQNVSQGVKGFEARAKFLKTMEKQIEQLPSAWESVEPNTHSYQRVEFVCRAKNEGK